MNALLLLLSLSGFLFSGYLSGVKFFTAQCAFGETCPLFLGYPACYFGFFMFDALVLASVLLVFSRMPRRYLHGALTIVSGVGVVFAGSFTLRELPLLFTQGVSAYVFGLPTCALGLIFFFCIFCISLSLWRKDTPQS